jgi:hypothetical protein
VGEADDDGRVGPALGGTNVSCRMYTSVPETFCSFYHIFHFVFFRQTLKDIRPGLELIISN